LKARANFENISEIWGCFGVVEVAVSIVSVMTKWEIKNNRIKSFALLSLWIVRMEWN
jgi:hypothetical protein